MTLAEAKELAEIIQAAALTLAAIIGGIWAAYRFRSLGELEKARLDLMTSSANLSKAGAEYDALRRSLQDRGTLSLKLVGEAFVDPRSKGLFIGARVTKDEAAFVLPVAAAGLHFLRITLPGSTQSLAEAARDAGHEVDTTEWLAETIVLVPRLKGRAATA